MFDRGTTYGTDSAEAMNSTQDLRRIGVVGLLQKDIYRLSALNSTLWYNWKYSSRCLIYIVRMWEPYDLDRREEEACILLAWHATIGCAFVNDPAHRQPASSTSTQLQLM